MTEENGTPSFGNDDGLWNAEGAQGPSFDAPPSDETPPQPIESHEELSKLFENSASFNPPINTESEPSIEDTLRPNDFSSPAEPSSPAYVPAAEPFNLTLTGKLQSYEQEKLVSILASENLGIRETDLQPQFDSGKILIPQISEYVGVMIVQALRDAAVIMRLMPSDEPSAPEPTIQLRSWLPESENSALHIPLVPGIELPGIPLQSIETLDGVSSSIRLQSFHAEVEDSEEYRLAVESLQRNLRFKARRLGADAVVHFKTQLTQLRDPDQYWLTAMGTAVKKKAF